MVTGSLSPSVYMNTTATTATSTGLPATKTTKTKAPLPSIMPVVQFEYPDSKTGEMKVRFLRVIKADAKLVTGYELVSPISKTDGQIKSFSRTRLVSNGVSLVSF